MTSKVSSGQSEIHRARMLPVVSTSAHGSLPRDGRKDRSGTDISGRKLQAHGFKPLFPLDRSNFVSKIVDRNKKQDVKDPKPRLATSKSERFVSNQKDLKIEVKIEDKEDSPPKLPPRKRLPANPPSNQVGRTERRTLPTPWAQPQVTNSRRANKVNSETLSKSSKSQEISATNENVNSLRRKSIDKDTVQSVSSNSNVQTSSKRNVQNSDVGCFEVNSQIKPDNSKTFEENSDSNPLTKTNVTQHDKIWVKDEPKHPPGTLTPPLQDITPETTEELWNNYDPLDNLDSGSDSSADTMIMMTTEEEKRNEEKIRQNKKQHEESSENKTPNSYATNMTNRSNFQNGGSYYSRNVKHIDLSPKSSEEDDGYGTNSSTSTNYSSLSSLGNGDLEHKPLQGILKKTGHSLPNGVNGNVIYANTSQQKQSQSTWAVRRRAKLTESQDNSLQEKLRQLAIIEEENTHDENQEDRLGIERRNSDAGSFGYSSDNDSHWKNVVNSKDDGQMTRKVRPSHEEEKQEEVIQNDLKKFEGELYDKLTDMDLNYRNYYGFDNSQNDDKDKSPKVLYFKDKIIQQQYDNDNYYNPSSNHSARQDYAQTLPTQSHRRQMPELCQRAYSGDPRQAPNYGAMNGYTSQNSSYRSLASMNSGQVSNYEYMNASNDNISVRSGQSLPGNLYKTKYVSVDNIHQNGRKTAFASSADIYNLFQSKENLATQLQRPASYRHSFHAVPVTVAAGRPDPMDVLNETSESRPRSSSASVASKNKWNPFGNLFGKKRKSSTSGEKSEKSKETNQNGEKRQGLKKSDLHHPHREGVASEILPRRQLAEETRPAVAPVIKSSTLPRHLPSDNMFPDKPFKTMAMYEESGTKLSTLV